MPLFYRGAGPGTYWQIHDAQQLGFVPQSPGMTPSINQLMQHVVRGTTNSCYISLTRSYDVATSYALAGPGGLATISNPGYAYEIEINPPQRSVQLLDPVKEVAAHIPGPLQSNYQHDGSQFFLLG